MQFSMIGISIDKKRSGSARAPDEIRSAFANAETFINGVDLRDHWMKDLGNVTSQDYDEIERELKEKLKPFPIVLGGDHSATLPAVKALKPKVFVSFDAHPDCYPGELTAKSVTRKISESGVKTFLYGVRTISKDESEFLSKGGVKVATLEDLKKISEPVYLSIDLDVLDPSIMPGVAYPEPDGLTFSQVIEGVRALAKNLVAIDFVEFVPPENKTYALIAGKLVFSSMAEIVKALR